MKTTVFHTFFGDFEYSHEVELTPKEKELIQKICNSITEEILHVYGEENMSQVH